MDLSTILGIIAGFGALIFGYILEKGTIGSLGGLSAAIIVFGGTAGAVLTSFPLSDLKHLPNWLKIAFTSQSFGTIEAYETALC